MAVRAFISLYTSLSEAEKNEFTKFINSPFFNENKIFIKLNSLLQNVSNDVLNNIDTDALIKDSYSGDTLSDEMLRRISSDFNNLLKKFFIQKEISSNKLSNKYFLLKSLRKRYLDTVYISEMQKTRSLLADKTSKTREYYIDRIRITLDDFIFNYLRQNSQLTLKNSIESEELIGLLHISISLIVFINSVTANHTFTPTSESRKNIAKALSQIKAKEDFFKETEPNIFVYYLLAILFLSDSNENLFKKLLDYIRQNINIFNETINETLLINLFKYCITRINFGLNVYTSHSYEILMVMKDNNLFDDLWEISDDIFIGCIIISLHNNNLEFAEDFLEKYYTKLNPLSRNEIVRICKALIYFKQNRFENAKKMLKDIKNTGLANYFFTKTTLLKIFYETNEIRHIYPLFDSLKHYLKRKPEVSPNMFESINKFLDYLLKLSKCKQQNGKNIDKVIYNLEKEKYFFHKNWLLEKAEEILKPIEN